MTVEKPSNSLQNDSLQKSATTKATHGYGENNSNLIIHSTPKDKIITAVNEVSDIEVDFCHGSKFTPENASAVLGKSAAGSQQKAATEQVPASLQAVHSSKKRIKKL